MTKFIVTHFSNGHFEDVEIEADWYEVQDHKELAFFSVIEACEEERTIAMFAEHRWTRVRRVEGGLFTPKGKVACCEMQEAEEDVLARKTLRMQSLLRSLEQLTSYLDKASPTISALDLYSLCESANMIIKGMIVVLKDE